MEGVVGEKGGTMVESHCHSGRDRRWDQLWLEALEMENKK